MKPKLQIKSHNTICDGVVYTIALGYNYVIGCLNGWEATGPFEISISRNAVMVHNCYCRTEESYSMFCKAVKIAWQIKSNLSKRHI